MVTFTSNRGGSSCYPCNSICVGTETKISYGCWFRSSHVRCVGSLANAYGETISHGWHCYGILVWSSCFFWKKSCGLPPEKLRYFPNFFGCLEDDQCLFYFGPLLRGHYIHFFFGGVDNIFFLLQEFLHGVEADKSTVDEIYPWEKLDAWKAKESSIF